jgi:hypothetical protein
MLSHAQIFIFDGVLAMLTEIHTVVVVEPVTQNG